MTTITIYGLFSANDDAWTIAAEHVGRELPRMPDAIDHDGQCLHCHFRSNC